MCGRIRRGCRVNLSGTAPDNRLVDIPAGEVRLGKTFADASYGWDNEYGEHHAVVPAFKAARHLVSNGEFLAFVEAGGYEDDSLWLEEGKAWKRFAKAHHPTFWRLEPEGWQLRLLTQIVDMPWDWPVETNFHEASAFCRWKARTSGAAVRLPSEDEWHRLLAVSGLGELPDDAPAAANIHLDHWASSCPVNTFAHGPLFDVVGNVWQWTETPIYPFDGFRVHPIYDDFTTPTFDERHNLIKGGSWISCGNEARHAARYAFRRHFFQHAGFRYVVGEPLAARPVSQYETDRLVSEYAEFHYGDEYFGVANFPRAVAELAIAAMAGRPAHKALDLGCATGRASFELARHFDRVTGLDFSARFIGVGVQLATQGSLRYTLVDEGELVSYRERRLSELGLEAVRDKVDFVQGDACNLKADSCRLRPVLAANLIDRLHSPRKLLESIHSPDQAWWPADHHLAVYLAGGAHGARGMDRRLQAGRRKLHHARRTEGDPRQTFPPARRTARRALRDPRNPPQIPAHPGRSNDLGTGGSRVSAQYGQRSQLVRRLASRRSSWLAKDWRSAWLKAGGPPVSTPLLRRTSMKLRMSSVCRIFSLL